MPTGTFTKANSGTGSSMAKVRATQWIRARASDTREGMYRFNDGKSFYRGSFAHSMFEGQGEEVWINRLVDEVPFCNWQPG